MVCLALIQIRVLDWKCAAPRRDADGGMGQNMCVHVYRWLWIIMSRDICAKYASNIYFQLDDTPLTLYAARNSADT